MFQTQYNHAPTVANRCGSRILDDHVLCYDADGCQFLKPCGKRNIYAFIQSHKDSCDLSTILSHLDAAEVNGMITTFKYNDLKDAGLVDLSHAPKSLGEMHNICMQGEHLFNGLPVEIRKEFNFSVQKFVGAIGTKEFDTVLQKFAPVQTYEEPIVEVKKAKRTVKKKVEDTADE